MESHDAIAVHRAVVEPEGLHSGLLVGPPQCEEHRLIRVGHHGGRIGRPAAGDGGQAVVAQTVARGMCGEDSGASARPSAARRYTIFIRSTYCATDSRAAALSG